MRNIQPFFVTLFILQLRFPTALFAGLIHFVATNLEGQGFTKIGDGLMLTLSEGQFPVDLSCSGNQPIRWRRLFDTETGDLFSPTSIRVRRTTTRIEDETNPSSYIYTSNLTLLTWNLGQVGKFRCGFHQSGGDYVEINIFLLSKDEDSSYFLEPGSTHKIIPVVGDKAIIIPCRLIAFTNDVIVEKVGSWSSSKIDLEFSPSKNGFIIETSGSYGELKRFAGNYRCSQISFGDNVAVRVEIGEPIDYSVSQNSPETGDVLQVNALSTISLTCSSHVPIKLVAVGHNKEMNVTYFYSTKDSDFAYKATLHYPTGYGDQGVFRCETSNQMVLHTWKYKSLDYELSLKITADEKQLRCATSPATDLNVQLIILSCGKDDECLMLSEYLRNLRIIKNQDSNKNYERVYSNSPEILYNECGDGCKVGNMLKSGGYVAVCELDEVHYIDTFVVDLDLAIHEYGSIVNEGSIAKISTVSEEEVESSVVICTWSSFYLTDNALLEIEPLDNDSDIQLLRELINGELQSKVIIPKDEKTRHLKCTLPLWNWDIVVPNRKEVEIYAEIKPIQKFKQETDVENQAGEIYEDWTVTKESCETRIRKLTIFNTLLLGVIGLLLLGYLIPRPTTAPNTNPVEPVAPNTTSKSQNEVEDQINYISDVSDEYQEPLSSSSWAISPVSTGNFTGSGLPSYRIGPTLKNFVTHSSSSHPTLQFFQENLQLPSLLSYSLPKIEKIQLSPERRAVKISVKKRSSRKQKSRFDTKAPSAKVPRVEVELEPRGVNSMTMNSTSVEEPTATSTSGKKSLRQSKTSTK